MNSAVGGLGLGFQGGGRGVQASGASFPFVEPVGPERSPRRTERAVPGVPELGSGDSYVAIDTRTDRSTGTSRNRVGVSFPVRGHSVSLRTPHRPVRRGRRSVPTKRSVNLFWETHPRGSGAVPEFVVVRGAPSVTGSAKRCPFLLATDPTSASSKTHRRVGSKV